MPTGFNPQVADTVFVPGQNDTSITGPFEQDSVVFQSPESVADSVVVIKDSVAGDTSAPATIRIEIQTDADTVQQNSSYLKNFIWNFNRNFLTENPLSEIQFFRKKDSLRAISVYEGIKNTEITMVSRKVSQEDWLTGLGLAILFLFIWIRIFYGKFYTMLADSITNYQISAKLYLEKNILIRRVSLILDFIYFIVFAVFIYELIRHFQIIEISVMEITMFGMVLGFLIMYSIVRILILRFTGFLLHNVSVFTEYIHHTYIFNKGLGIVLFPLVIMVFFIPSQLVTWVLTAGIVIYLVSFIMKVIRAYKIIIRKDILLFYMILYLCTLEILPLLLGYKVMKALILSY